MSAEQEDWVARYERGQHRYPYTPYPIGWFRMLYADDLAVGEVKKLHRFGRELVAFRTESGRACVADAHCPHLGAHLGFGGEVVGEAIRCPFHHWEFEGESGRDHSQPSMGLPRLRRRIEPQQLRREDGHGRRTRRRAHTGGTG